MEKTKTKKRGVAAIFAICPAAHILLLVSCAVTASHLALRGNTGLMRRLSKDAVRPLHQRMALFYERLGTVSAAEIIIGVFASAVIGFVIYELVCMITKPERLRRLYRLIVWLLALGMTVYALFCLSWGVYYYGDDFMTESGLERREISTQELETVTVYFAELLNEYSSQVERDGNGLYRADREEILKKSPEVFRNIERSFPCLSGPAVSAKGIYFSRLLSYFDFTGFFFPFTAEANVNTDFPPGQFAATVAHELSHQRGVAKEQEANFTAVLASLAYGDTDYCYSACMLAYVYLGNALASADAGAWELVYRGLSDGVKADLNADREYWRRFETPVQTVSNTVYEGFLKSYDQTLGLKSYGACVDLLVCYYFDTAENYFAISN